MKWTSIPVQERVGELLGTDDFNQFQRKRSRSFARGVHGGESSRRYAEPRTAPGSWRGEGPTHGGMGILFKQATLSETRSADSG